MTRMPSFLLSLSAAALVVAVGCNPKGDPIASPDPHAAPATTAEAPAQKQGARDVASVCAEATAVASAAPSTWRRAASEASYGGTSIAVLGAFGDRSDRYSISDLQALEKKGQLEELLQHIEDIAPSARTTTWDTLLVRAATKLVGSLAADADTYRAFGAMMTAESLLQRYPQLGAATEFMAARSQAGEHMFGKCFEMSYSGEECVNMALDFVRVEGTDAKTALAVAKVVRRNQNAYVAVPFFKIALGSKDHGACSDEDLELATTAGLGLPPDYDNAKASRDIAQNVCFSQLEKPLVARLTGDDGGGYFRDNACAVLRAKGVVK